MAANPKLPVEPDDMKPIHVYHAEAHVLSGSLKHPIEQPIPQQALVVLGKTQLDGHIMQSVEGTTLEGLISFKAGHSRASGSKIAKKDLWGNDHSGWVTLSTSVIEGLNVFEVITADRVVAQVSTEHAENANQKDKRPDHVPRVTFLGTRFENLQVGGYPVQVELDLDICGSKPENDQPYLQDRGFLNRVQRQLEGIAGAKGLPESLEQAYDSKIAYIDDLKKRANGGAKGQRNGYSKLQCSLVKSIGPIPIPGVRTFGNIIFIPDFGTVSLAEVEVGIEAGNDASSEQTGSGSPQKSGYSNYFALDMLNMHLGCIGGGTVKAGSAKSNGETAP
jgi:hypothetical protein